MLYPAPISTFFIGILTDVSAKVLSPTLCINALGSTLNIGSSLYGMSGMSLEPPPAMCTSPPFLNAKSDLGA